MNRCGHHTCDKPGDFHVVGIRTEDDYRACDDHAIAALRLIHCEVSNDDGELYRLTETLNLEVSQ